MNNSQEVANSIKKIAKLQKVAIGKMLSDCELSINTLASMQSGGYYPRLEAISKIADYLGCSVDYLLGRTDSPYLAGKSGFLPDNAATFSDSSLDEINAIYDKLNEAGKISLLAHARFLSSSDQYVESSGKKS